MNNLIKSNLSILILERFYVYLSPIFEDILINSCSKKMNKYEIHYIAGGLYQILIKWIENGFEESTEEITGIFCSFVNK